MSRKEPHPELTQTKPTKEPKRPDLSKLTPVEINDKLTVWISDRKDASVVKAKYLEALKRS